MKTIVSKLVSGYGRGIRIRTLNDGVRVRSVTVTLYLYIHSHCSLSRTSGIIHTAGAIVKGFIKLFLPSRKIYASCPFLPAEQCVKDTRPLIKIDIRSIMV